MSLNKVKLQEYYNTLSESYSEYMMGYQQWKNGSNIKKREAGLAIVERVIRRVQGIVESQQLLFELAAEPENFYESFMSIRYFHRDMPLFLKRIDDSLKAFN